MLVPSILQDNVPSLQLRLMQFDIAASKWKNICLQIRTGEWYAADGKAKHKASQYFEVIGHTCGGWLGAVALILTVFNLMGNGTAQARPFLPIPCPLPLGLLSCQGKELSPAIALPPVYVCRLEWIDLLPLLTKRCCCPARFFCDAEQSSLTALCRLWLEPPTPTQSIPY